MRPCSSRALSVKRDAAPSSRSLRTNPRKSGTWKRSLRALRMKGAQISETLTPATERNIRAVVLFNSPAEQVSAEAVICSAGELNRTTALIFLSVAGVSVSEICAPFIRSARSDLFHIPELRGLVRKLREEGAASLFTDNALLEQGRIQERHVVASLAQTKIRHQLSKFFNCYERFHLSGVVSVLRDFRPFDLKTNRLQRLVKREHEQVEIAAQEDGQSLF